MQLRRVPFHGRGVNEPRAMDFASLGAIGWYHTSSVTACAIGSVDHQAHTGRVTPSAAALRQEERRVRCFSLPIKLCHSSLCTLLFSTQKQRLETSRQSTLVATATSASTAVITTAMSSPGRYVYPFDKVHKPLPQSPRRTAPRQEPLPPTAAALHREQRRANRKQHPHELQDIRAATHNFREWRQLVRANPTLLSADYVPPLAVTSATADDNEALLVNGSTMTTNTKPTGTVFAASTTTSDREQPMQMKKSSLPVAQIALTSFLLVAAGSYYSM
jgi:hypothetical protein